MRFGRILPLALGVAAACNRTSLPDEPAGSTPNLSTASLVASAGPDGVSLENRGSTIVRFAVIDSLWFETALALWCLGADECGTPLSSGDRRLVPAAEIEGPSPAGKAIQVLWWEVVPGPSDDKAGNFQRIHLRLP